MKAIKEIYSEYKEAEKRATYAELNLSEDEFDKAVDEECEKLDELVNAVVKMAKGALRDFDVRQIAMNPKYAKRFESIICNMA